MALARSLHVSTSQSMLRRALDRLHRSAGRVGRAASTAAGSSASAKREGDISDAFVSLSGAPRAPLPERFRQLKRELAAGREGDMADGWARLLRRLGEENDEVARLGSAAVPQVAFGDLDAGLGRLRAEIRKRGAVVVRGVIPEAEARAYKDEIEAYVGRNPHTRAFPAHDRQVLELYWSAAQLQARAHPRLLRVQRRLMASLWHAAAGDGRVSLATPLAYADRLRIRQPGDAAFALGPHMDGGSVERWERGGYGRGGVYDGLLAGRWEQHDAWDAGRRAEAVSNLYGGLGACSVFRAWQGWLSMSRAGPGEGTLLVHPLMHLGAAYVLLRPFFRPRRGPGSGGRARFLAADNWVLTGGADITSELHGASPGHGQEVSDELHPHLELGRTMVHVPEVRPGDYVAWHCDTIHAVDKVHAGRSDSSVLYAPACPLTAPNAEYLARQRQAFARGAPPPDFPGGAGEARHVGRPGDEAVRGSEGRQAMGLERLEARAGAARGEREAVESTWPEPPRVERANAVLGFA